MRKASNLHRKNIAKPPYLHSPGKWGIQIGGNDGDFHAKSPTVSNAQIRHLFEVFAFFRPLLHNFLQLWAPLKNGNDGEMRKII
jgi:hypothetical protein